MSMTMEVTVVGCRGVKGKDWLSESDPYVVLKYGGLTHRTRVAEDAGADADFHETFHFPVKHSRAGPPPTGMHKDTPPPCHVDGEMEVRVLDKDFLIDQLLGRHSLHLATLPLNGSTAWYGEVPLHDKKGRPNGTVMLSVKLKAQ